MINNLLILIMKNMIRNKEFNFKRDMFVHKIILYINIVAIMDTGWIIEARMIIIMNIINYMRYIIV